MDPNYISEVDIDGQASPMHQLEETKITQDENLVEMMSELQKIVDDTSASRIVEEEPNLEFINEKYDQPEIDTIEVIDLLRRIWLIGWLGA